MSNIHKLFWSVKTTFRSARSVQIVKTVLVRWRSHEMQFTDRQRTYSTGLRFVDAVPIVKLLWHSLPVRVYWTTFHILLKEHGNGRTALKRALSELSKQGKPDATWRRTVEKERQLITWSSGQSELATENWGLICASGKTRSSWAIRTPPWHE